MIPSISGLGPKSRSSSTPQPTLPHCCLMYPGLPGQMPDHAVFRNNNSKFLCSPSSVIRSTPRARQRETREAGVPLSEKAFHPCFSHYCPVSRSFFSSNRHPCPFLHLLINRSAITSGLSRTFERIWSHLLTSQIRKLKEGLALHGTHPRSHRQQGQWWDSNSDNLAPAHLLVTSMFYKGIDLMRKPC